MTKIKVLDEDLDEFRSIDKYYQENPLEDRLISIVNTLSQVERNIIIMYMQYDNNIKVIANKLNITPSYLRCKINEIKRKIKELF